MTQTDQLEMAIPVHAGYYWMWREMWEPHWGPTCVRIINEDGILHLIRDGNNNILSEETKPGTWFIGPFYAPEFKCESDRCDKFVPPDNGILDFICQKPINHQGPCEAKVKDCDCVVTWNYPEDSEAAAT